MRLVENSASSFRSDELFAIYGALEGSVSTLVLSRPSSGVSMEGGNWISSASNFSFNSEIESKK
jgi:hypothetical protein